MAGLQLVCSIHCDSQKGKAGTRDEEVSSRPHRFQGGFGNSVYRILLFIVQGKKKSLFLYECALRNNNSELRCNVPLKPKHLGEERSLSVCHHAEDHLNNHAKNDQRTIRLPPDQFGKQ